MFNDKIQSVKTHFSENKKVYIVGGVCFVVGAAGAVIVYCHGGNKANIDSWKFINWKSPHTSQTIQVVIPPMGNSGNAVQCEQTGIIYPSQNLAAKVLNLNPGNLSSHLNGKNSDVKGFTFIKITQNGEPIAE